LRLFYRQRPRLHPEAFLGQVDTLQIARDPAGIVRRVDVYLSDKMEILVKIEVAVPEAWRLPV
jgi:hypothetical protein